MPLPFNHIFFHSQPDLWRGYLRWGLLLPHGLHGEEHQHSVLFAELQPDGLLHRCVAAFRLHRYVFWFCSLSISLLPFALSTTACGSWSFFIPVFVPSANPTCGLFACPWGYTEKNGSTVCSSLTCSQADCCTGMHCLASSCTGWLLILSRVNSKCVQSAGLMFFFFFNCITSRYQGFRCHDKSTMQPPRHQ